MKIEEEPITDPNDILYEGPRDEEDDEKWRAENREIERVLRHENLDTSNDPEDLTSNYPVARHFLEDISSGYGYTKEKIGEYREDRRDKKYIEHGVPLSDIKEFNEFEKKYKRFKGSGDKADEKKYKDLMRDKKREINQKIKKDEIYQKKLENSRMIEDAKLKQLLRYGKKPSGGRKIVRDLPTYGTRSFQQGMDTSYFGQPNVAFNKFKQMDARQKILANREQKLREIQAIKIAAAKRDQTVQQAFATKQSIGNVKGTMRGFNPNGLDAVLTRKPRSVSVAIKKINVVGINTQKKNNSKIIRQIEIKMPKINAPVLNRFKKKRGK